LLEVLSSDHHVKPGMTANVEIEVDRREEALTVPVESVVHRMRKDLPESIVKAFDERQAGLDISERVRKGQYIKVLYVIEDETARVRLVDTGIADTRQVEIRTGINADDNVIVGPYRSLDQLEDGRKVALANDKKQEKQGEDPTDDKVADDDSDDDKESEPTHTVATSSTP